MDFLAPIDQYCERIDASYFSEPLNLATNLSFLAAAYLLRKKQHPHASHVIKELLVGLIFSIGIGSALFHFFANRLTLFFDVLPILIFIITYLYLYLKVVAQFERIRLIFGFVVFFILSAAASWASDLSRSGGSHTYFGTWIVLFGISMHWLATHKNDNFRMFFAFMIFSISLAARSVDLKVCPHFAMGTHFLWHLLNGLMLFIVSDELLKFSQTSDSHLQS